MKLNQYIKFVGYIILLAVSSTYVSGKKYAPIIEEGKIWQYGGDYYRQCDGHTEGGIVYHSMKFDGSITVNEKEYHRFLLFESEYYKGAEEYGVLELAEIEQRSGPCFFLREENGKVYVLTLDDIMFSSSKPLKDCLDPSIPEDRYGEFLRYDFTLVSGNDFMLPSNIIVNSDYLIPVTIKVRNPTLVDGFDRKTITFCEQNREMPNDFNEEDCTVIYPGSVIEGIGPDMDGDIVAFGPPYSTGIPNNTNGPGYGSWLKCVTDKNGNVIYGSKLGVVDESSHSMLSSGKMWKWEFVTPESEHGITVATVTVNDTPVYANGRPSRRVSVISEDDAFNPINVILSEENGSLYMYRSDNVAGTYATWAQLIDFRLLPGERVFFNDYESGEIWGTPSGVVHSVYKKYINGIERQFQRIYNENDGHEIAVWVEGVGSENVKGLMTKFIELDSGKYFRNMLECYEDGVCVFTSEDFSRGQDSIESVHDSETTNTNLIYDLMGRRVDRVLPGSVYIRDGKKFVGK